MSTIELRQQPLGLEPVDDVPADATVRHVDQLDERTLDAVLAAVDDGGPVPKRDLEPGDILVLTDYYRLEH